MLILAAIIATFSLLQREARARVLTSWSVPGVRLFCYAMAAPFAAILLSEGWHGNIVMNTLDSPSRFLMAIPIFLALQTRRIRIAPWSSLTFGLGGLGAAAVVVFAPFDWGSGRIGSTFLNPIHFGDIACVLAVLSLVSIDWFQRDALAIRIFKVCGALCAAYASLAGGSRGGWVAVPAVVLLLAALGMRDRAWWQKLAAVVCASAVIAIPFVFSPTVQSRFGELQADIHSLERGQEDTSVGVRLQLWKAGGILFSDHPVLGLGALGYKKAMSPLTQEDVLTPLAAELGRGESHNQLIAYAVDYGTPGLLAILLLYAGPAFTLWRQLHAPSRERRHAALMGLVYILSFFIFGLTVETFTLKLTAAIYSTVLAVLAGLAMSRSEGGSSAAHSSTYE
ncbi:lipopolysaccharide o-antigen ligase protein [Pandoraea terrae]|uniref:Lipopolysaccharide o-antigen ligase protein n=1 Tax=Pandoraea terrae TaxID=1537710 RepID=A0A5E4Y7U4_9BURK|nr:O-antigen ligase family protein [Pandoraea terrae]VVE44851.1 lipopolysaccharide o-antigen ligase protein [Pandoraea terrae]